MARRIVIMDEFKEAAAGLGLGQSTARHIQDIAEYLARHPAGTPTLDDTGVHDLRTRGYDDHPALRLYYTFDADTLYLMDLALHDQLSG